MNILTIRGFNKRHITTVWEFNKRHERITTIRGDMNTLTIRGFNTRHIHITTTRKFNKRHEHITTIGHSKRETKINKHSLHTHTKATTAFL
jgi:hypothetical protein